MVRYREKLRGRRLRVKVKWAGERPDSWTEVTQLTADMRKRAKEMEGVEYGRAAAPTGV